jgi:hypothetical protein
MSGPDLDNERRSQIDRDRRAVEDVMSHYARTIDDLDFDGFRSLFDPDVVLPGFGAEPIRGVETWVAFVRKTLGVYSSTQHLLGRPLVEVDGSHATARTDLQAMHRNKDPNAGIFMLWGTYRTQLERGGGPSEPGASLGWRIVRHELNVRTIHNLV